MTKLYYAANISTTGESVDSIRIANNLRQLGYKVYAAAENKTINDKSNDPTPDDIYDGDIPEIKGADIVVVNITGGLQDGTMTEVGFVTGYNEAKEDNENDRRIQLIGFTTSTRLLQPQHHKGMASASASALALGMIERHGTFVGNERNLYEYLLGNDSKKLSELGDVE